MPNKNILFALLISLICANAQADGFQKKHYITGAFGLFSTGRSSLESTTNSNTNPSTVSPNPLSGIMGLGVDYEMRILQAVGVGASVRYYSTKDDFPQGNNTNTKHKFNMLSAMVFGRAHINSKFMDIYISPGIGMVKPDYEITSASGTVTEYDISTSFGVDMTMGILYKWTSQMAFGVENKRIYGVGSKHNGHLVTDWMLTFRYRFM